MATNKQRDQLQTYMDWLISKAPQIHYEAVRPMPCRALTYAEAVATFRRGGSIGDDCSGMVTLLCRWAGLKDPSGFGYNGFGNSTSMYQHLTKRYTDPKRAHVGAIVVFGPSVHVCMVQERNGSNPWLFSHGQESGPLHISLEEESAFHHGQARYFLDISHL